VHRQRTIIAETAMVRQAQPAKWQQRELPKIATGKIQKYVLHARQSAIAPQ
jgi:hypothetical protein